MHIDEFDRLEPAEAAAAVRPCVDIDSWVDALVAGRPWGDPAALHAAAARQAATWSDAEVEGALAGHPRIGERSSSPLSSAEQAGVDPADLEVAQRLAAGNHRYEERFGRIYLVRAAGRSAEEMLDLLDRRLGHDDATEREETRSQLAEIALLRLAGVVS